MAYNNDNIPIVARTNDDFAMQVDAGFDITGMIPLFSIKGANGEIDLSSFCTIVSATAFIISINADDVKTTIGAITAPYDVVIDQGAGSKEFLFGGQISVTEGVA